MITYEFAVDWNVVVMTTLILLHLVENVMENTKIGRLLSCILVIGWCIMLVSYVIANY